MRIHLNDSTVAAIKKWDSEYRVNPNNVSPANLNVTIDLLHKIANEINMQRQTEQMLFEKHVEDLLDTVSC